MTVKEKKDIGRILKERLDTSENTQIEIAKSIGITKGYMSKFLSGKEIAFWMVIQAVQYISPDKEKELMKNYCKSGIDKKHIFCALEYCYTQKMFDVMRYLIVEYSAVAPEPCILYKWILNYRGNFEMQNISKLRMNNFKTKEAKTLLLILETYGYYNLGKYDMAHLYINKADSCMNNMKDPFLRKSFSARIDEVLANVYLKQENNVELARLAATSLLENKVSESHEITANHLLALSYFLTSYEKSITYYNKLLNLMEQHPERVDEILQNKEEIAILQYYWKTNIDSRYNVSEFTKNLKEHKKLSDYYSDERLKPYAYLFDGVKEERADKILLSLHYFSEKREYFRANIPKQELQKLELDYKL